MSDTHAPRISGSGMRIPDVLRNPTDVLVSMVDGGVHDRRVSAMIDDEQEALAPVDGTTTFARAPLWMWDESEVRYFTCIPPPNFTHTLAHTRTHS